MNEVHAIEREENIMQDITNYRSLAFGRPGGAPHVKVSRCDRDSVFSLSAMAAFILASGRPVLTRTASAVTHVHKACRPGSHQRLHVWVPLAPEGDRLKKESNLRFREKK